MPRESVWSRRIGEGLERGDVAETLEARSIVVVNEAVEEGIAVGVGDKEPMGDAAFGLPTYGLDDATVEALDEAIGLRAVRFCEAMVNSVLGADTIEGVTSGRPVVRLVLHVDCETIGKLAAVIGEDGVNPMREVSEEALEEARRGFGVAAGMDLQIDIAGGAIDGDEGIALAFFQGRQVLEIDMDEADGCQFEDADPRRVGAGTAVEAVAHQAAMDGAAREFAINTTAHHLGDVVERQLQTRVQFTDERLLHRRQANHQTLGSMRAIRCRGALAPAADRCLAHTQFGRQVANRALAALDIGPRLRGGCGVGVQAQFHDARRSLRYAMPRSTPIPFNQSS